MKARFGIPQHIKNAFHPFFALAARIVSGMRILMSVTYLVTLAAALALYMSACTTELDVLTPDKPTGSSNDPGQVTEVGKPIGLPVSKTIGTGGGSLTTPDGSLSLDFPPGALSQSSTITLQLVEKTLPSGAGPAFTISPKDLKLNKPVSIVWHYTQQSISGSAPELVGVAFQDEKGIWNGRQNVIVDKVNKSITARVRNFSHPIAWYEQYFMTPQAEIILPNQQVNFSVFFQAGRTDQSGNPDDDVLVPLPPLLQGDEILRELEEQELKNWRLNGESGLSYDRQYVVGSLDWIGQGEGAFYKAPRAMIPKVDNPLAISVELKLKQLGLITLVSNLTMTDPENEFKIGGKIYKNAYVEVITQGGGCVISMWENTDKPSNNRANVSAGIDQSIFKGNGTYVLEGNTMNVIAGAFDTDDSYGLEWVPEPNVLEYGPVTITITQAGEPGLPIAGHVSAKLHRYIENEKRWEHVDVTAKFRVINNYFTGG